MPPNVNRNFFGGRAKEKERYLGTCPLQCACHHVHSHDVYIAKNQGFWTLKTFAVAAIFLLEIELKNSAILERGDSQLSKAVYNFSVRLKLRALQRFKVLKISCENRCFSQISLAVNVSSSFLGGS